MSWTDKCELNDDGDWIQTRTVKVTPGATKEVEINVTKMLQSAPRKTGNHELLLLEAEMVANGTTLKNPAKPGSAKIAEAVIPKIEANGHEPAWRVCDRVDYP